MNIDEIQHNVYKPMIYNFCESTKEIYWNMWKEQIDFDLSGLFIPHCLQGYESASKRIMYLGRDTYEWTSLESVYNAFDSDTLDLYIDENNSWPGNVDELIKYITNNKSISSFWNFVCKLHLQINGTNCINRIDSNIGKEERKILSEICWGNVNALEVPETIKKYKYNDTSLIHYYDAQSYEIIREKSKEISKIKHVLKVFDPDYIIILNWDNNIEDWILEGINYTWNKDDYEDRIISTYDITNTEKKIIWCCHPNRLHYIGLNNDELIDRITNIFLRHS